MNIDSIAAATLNVLDHGVIGYFLLLHTAALGLLLLAGRVLVGSSSKLSRVEADEIFANPLAPGVSMIVPVHNGETTIVPSVKSLLDLNYPDLEVIVVDDGSTDETFARLSEAFGLVRVEHVITDDIHHTGSATSTHRSLRGDPLLVVRKDTTGPRADAINIGVNAARTSLVGVADGNATMDPEALLHLVRPFLDDPQRVVGVGGTVFVDDRFEVDRSGPLAALHPRRWLARVQMVEYLRSFLFARVAWSQMNALLTVAGAFGVFRRDILVSAGGLDLDSSAEDAELITRLHRKLRDVHADYRIEFVSEPLCWSRALTSPSEIRTQRRQWARGLTELTWSHRSMIANPRYGRLGMLMLPFALLFELVGAAVETVAVVVVLGGFAAGLVDTNTLVLFVMVAWVYGWMVSVATLTIHELSSVGSQRWPDLGLLVVAAIFEVVIFRPLLAIWRLEGIVDAFRKQVPPAVSAPEHHARQELVDASWQ